MDPEKLVERWRDAMERIKEERVKDGKQETALGAYLAQEDDWDN